MTRESKKLGLGAKIGIAALTTLANLGMTDRAKAATFNPSDSISYINQTIQNSSDPSHTFNAGTYNFTGGEYIEMGKNNTSYTFDNSGVIFTSDIPTDGTPFISLNGGENIDLSGNLNLRDRKNGIHIHSSIYNNINLSNIHFETTQYGVRLYNIEHASETTTASVNITNCLFEGNEKGIKYDLLGQQATINSPYAGVFSSTFSGLSSQAMDMPKYVLNGTSVEVKGNNEFVGNALINTQSIINSSDYEYFSSPSFTGYLNVAEPFLEDGITIDSNGNEIVTEAAKIGDYQLLLTDGSIVGYQPVPEPFTMSILGLGGLGLLLERKKK